ncbi:MAG: hypothetical protein HY303_14865 [Candidatus Wallbacteria bacterium]|nr:hypothetical protein [Candidatus Wallbacteria bacterium]
MNSKRLLVLMLLVALTQGLTGHADARSRHRHRKPGRGDRVAAPEASLPAPQTATATATVPTSAPAAAALSPAEIGRRVAASLAAAQARKPDTDDALALDRASFLANIDRPGFPYAVRAGSRVLKYLVPALTRDRGKHEERVCGLIHVEPSAGGILAWPLFCPGGKPVSLRTEAEALTRLEGLRGQEASGLKSETEYSPMSIGDPGQLPGAYLIRGWDRLPAQVQDPLLEYVAQLNASGRLRQPLHYDETQLDPPLKSIPVAAALVADWWRSRMAMPPLTHTGWLTGLAQQGVDPREIEVQYRERGLPCLPLAMMRDPVTGEPPTLGLEGFCKVLTEVRAPLLTEPLERAGITRATTYAAAPWRYGMEAEYVSVVSREMRDQSTIQQNATKVEQALRAHGILLARFDSKELRRKMYALHGAAIIGRADIDGRPCVVFAEVYADRGIDFPLTGVGRPIYKAMPVERIYSAYAFPHHVKLALARRETPGQFDLTAASAVGKPLDLDALDVRLGGVLSLGVSLGGRTPRGLSVMRRDRGLYRITIPRAAQTDPTARLIVAADCEHFREPGGRPATESFELAHLPPATK